MYLVIFDGDLIHDKLIIMAEFKSKNKGLLPPI